MSKKKVYLIAFRHSTDLSDFLVSKDFENIRRIIRERRFTAGSTDVPYRVINHWDEKGVLPEGFRSQKRGWRNFSIVELIWISILVELRNFGLPLQTLQRVTGDVMEWSKKEKGYPLFEYYVCKAFSTKADIHVFVSSSGDSAVGSSAEYEINKIVNKSQTNIQISLKSILTRLGFEVPEPETLVSLSDEEFEVIDALRDSDINKVKLKRKNGEWYEIETSEIISENPDINKISRGLSELGSFAEVISKFEKGKSQSAEIKKKKRLK